MVTRVPLSSSSGVSPDSDMHSSSESPDREGEAAEAWRRSPDDAEGGGGPPSIKAGSDDAWSFVANSNDGDAKDVRPDPNMAEKQYMMAAGAQGVKCPICGLLVKSTDVWVMKEHQRTSVRCGSWQRWLGLSPPDSHGKMTNSATRREQCGTCGKWINADPNSRWQHETYGACNKRKEALSVDSVCQSHPLHRHRLRRRPWMVLRRLQLLPPQISP